MEGDFSTSLFAFEINESNDRVFLDDLEAEPGYLLTGLKFVLYKENPNDKGALKLAIHTTKFDSRSGMLWKDSSVWLQNNLATNQRFELKIQNTLPTKSKGKSSSITNGNGFYVRFQVSSLKQDIGQSTVPFIDSQSVDPYPLSIITGAGLYHKGAHNSGGFIGVKLLTDDITPYIDLKVINSGINTQNAEFMLRVESARGNDSRSEKDLNIRPLLPFNKCYNTFKSFEDYVSSSQSGQIRRNDLNNKKFTLKRIFG